MNALIIAGPTLRIASGVKLERPPKTSSSRLNKHKEDRMEGQKPLKSLRPRVSQISCSRVANPATERIRGNTLKKIRKRILLRDRYTCQVCGRVGLDLEIDHIVPLYLGGAESDENRWLL